jgi:RNA polymerase sigma-70 factor (ECF subfamily)
MRDCEAELIRRLKGGEPAAFVEFTEQFGSRIYDAQCWLCGDRTTAEDLAQDTVVAVFRDIHGFRGDSGLYTWVYRIARRIAQHYLRRNVDNSVSLDQAGEIQSPDDTEEQANRSILRDHIREALQTLPIGQRESLVLHCLQGLSHTETASVLKRPLGTVKWQIAEGLHALRDALKKAGADADEL